MAEKNYRAELTGCFGDPVDGNPTGVLMEAGYAAAGLNYRYITCRVKVEDLEDSIRGMRAMNMRGVNLTMPHKIEVIRHLDGLSEAARIIGAVNVVINDNGRLTGENSDGKGFVQSLTLEGVSLKDKTLTILGAGGAAKAIGVECALAGAKQLHIINRNAQRGEELVNTINQHTSAKADYIPWNGTADIPADTEILVNATCVGLFPDVDACPDVNYDQITSGMVVADVIFNPIEPLFIRKAAAKGAKVVPGIAMLVDQGVIGFKCWTGVDPSREIMMDALKKEFEG